jgi:hypothetical protein
MASRTPHVTMFKKEDDDEEIKREAAHNSLADSSGEEEEEEEGHYAGYVLRNRSSFVILAPILLSRHVSERPHTILWQILAGRRRKRKDTMQGMY